MRSMKITCSHLHSLFLCRNGKENRDYKRDSGCEVHEMFQNLLPNLPVDIQFYVSEKDLTVAEYNA